MVHMHRFAVPFRALLLMALGVGPVMADCSLTETGRVPLFDLGANVYSIGEDQWQGGLYPGGSNVPPDDYLAEGLAIASSIRPLNSG
ncbi:MAG: hypothetical protein JJU11_12975, partial [Candidatus Sumerlaeia bacterium]|nr:hypothetical protein [Candidatus Sumerlaeia bacterium]